ncbi:MAG: TonB-dependent receptor, partial [Acidobacteriia bacterium]|nr:TonB-dependent receptor [Terriglobia bacterium]
MRGLCVVFLVSLAASVALAQTDRGTITGTVSDPAGAVVANATVEAKNTESGAVYQAATSSTGNFTLAQLPVGTYELDVAASGFKRYVRPGIIVEVAGTVRVDAALQVGSATESITIEAEAPLLKTESGELSHNVDYNRVDQIPLLTLGTPGTLGNVRNPLQVVTLLPGAAFAGENTLRINGMPSSSQAIRIEGQDATNGFWREINQNVQGSVDAIQEVAIQTSNYAAEYGQAGGGYFNYTMKSGANQFHGSGYDYFDNEALNAGLPFTNNGSGGLIRNTVRRNDYGFTLGGPIFIPKVYNGRDKTFFFFSFEQFRENQVVRNGIASVPTAAYRNGNFSSAQLGSLGLKDSLGQMLFQNEIFDPNSTRVGPDGSPVRTPYPNATIPMSQMDPVALKIQSLLPLPLGPTSNNLVNNYAIPAYSNFRHTTIPSVKLDHSISPTVKISGYWQQTHTLAPNNNGFNPSQFPWSPVEPTDTTNNTGRINYDQTVKPTLLLHLGIGMFYTDQPAIPPSFNVSSLGPNFAPFYVNQFPNIIGIVDSTIVPVVGGASVPLGQGFAVQWLKDVKPTANANLTWVKANHTFKAGGEMVVEGFPQVNYTRANGSFGFGPNQTGDPWEFQKTTFATTGLGYASFLIGAPNSLTVSQLTDSRLGNHSLGFFIQDSWKVTRRFTLDYGVRYDYVTLLREEHGRMQSASFTTPNPLAGGRLGNVIYEATCGCRFNHNYPYAIGPHLGAAFQITDKTVLR